LIIYLMQSQTARATALIALVVLLFTALYLVSITRFGKRFERQPETIARALS